MSVAIIIKMTTLAGRLALLIREDAAARAQYFLRVVLSSTVHARQISMILMMVGRPPIMIDRQDVDRR
jgi:hypothetical protein